MSIPQILILEDQPLIAMDVESMLVDSGLGVASILSSCASALEWLVNARPDAVVLDIGLSDGSCIDVAARLIALDIPFVVHSGSERAQTSLNPIFRRGQWVGKPSNESDLIAAVQAAVVRRPVALS